VKVGFVGLGRMGYSMAANLALKRGGSRLSRLWVFNRTTATAHEFKKTIDARMEGEDPVKIIACDTLKELIQNANVIFTCLTDVKASEEVFLGPDGVIPNARAEQIFVDFSTVTTNTTTRCYQAAQQMKCHFLDAPISGGPEGAKNATLTIMIGGEEEPYKKIHGILQKMGVNIVYMGKSGSGTKTKLVNQLLTACHTLAACEAMVLADKFGLDKTKIGNEVLAHSYGNSKMLQRTIPVIVENRLGTDSGTPLRNMLKDLNIIQKVLEEEKLELPSTTTTREAFNRAAHDGYEMHDMAILFSLLKK